MADDKWTTYGSGSGTGPESFKSLIVKASAAGADEVRVAWPGLLGETLEEVMHKLKLIAAAGLAVRFAAPEPTQKTGTPRDLTRGA